MEQYKPLLEEAAKYSKGDLSLAMVRTLQANTLVVLNDVSL